MCVINQLRAFLHSTGIIRNPTDASCSARDTYIHVTGIRKRAYMHVIMRECLRVRF